MINVYFTGSDLVVPISYEDYKDRLSAQSIFNISVMANVMETDYQVQFISSTFPNDDYYIYFQF